MACESSQQRDSQARESSQQRDSQARESSQQRDSHWPLNARGWPQIGQPLQPNGEDLGLLRAVTAEWCRSHGIPRVLLLGVPPEVYRLPWPSGTDVLAVDANQAMIDHVWPGPKEQAHCANWLAMGLPDSSRDIVICDGGLHLLAYPQGQQRLVSTLRRALSERGICWPRGVCRRRPGGSPGRSDAHAARVCGLHRLGSGRRQSQRAGHLQAQLQRVAPLPGRQLRGACHRQDRPNAGGIPEHFLARFRRWRCANEGRNAPIFAKAPFRQHLAWRTVLRRYPIYESLAHVPPVAGKGPFLKRAGCVGVDEGLEVPEAVLALRRRLGLDYGKIDYVIHDGEPVILDVNRTPASPGPETIPRTVGDVAGGIWSLLPASRQAEVQ